MLFWRKYIKMERDPLETLTHENKMGTMPINRLLISMAVPMMISMLVQALYNVVDSIFVSRIDEFALTAVGLAFPLQNLLIAFAVGFGVGLNALISRALGEKDPERANRIASTGFALEGLSYLIFLVIGLFFAEPIAAAQLDESLPPEDAAIILGYTVEYLRIVLIFSFGVFIEIGFERLLQSTGKTLWSMVTQLIGAVFNIIFDPILIFGWFGLPAMGIAGAAIATVGGQILAAFCAFFINRHKNHELHLSFIKYPPSLRAALDISRISIPSIVMSSISSVMTFFMNRILTGFTSTAAAVFGVYFKLQSFVFMPVFGLNNGMVPIIGYNYGAKMPERVNKTIRCAMIYATAIMFAGFAVFQLMPRVLLGFFDPSADMLRIGAPALRIISLSFIFAGVCVICSSACQAFGYGMYSLYISVARQLFVLVPVAWLMSLTGELDNVWLSFPIAEIVSIAASVSLLLRVLNKTGMRIKKQKTAS